MAQSVSPVGMNVLPFPLVLVSRSSTNKWKVVFLSPLALRCLFVFGYQKSITEGTTNMGSDWSRD